ncbi:hypothetical protein GCM10010982_21120 [Bowmanella pacifica]|uniref:Uncharacterized protein n=1 Tax=Bowmanella pacifica TaxID=502051 RepID=A0A917YZ77_9ALTE|nr:hypothetical protein GCM10010982_21120 [Bowmanella pacifica]
MKEQLAFFELPEGPGLSRHDAAHESNTKFCIEVEETLVHCGYNESPNLESAWTYIKNNSFKDLYGANRHSAFVINHPRLGQSG